MPGKRITDEQVRLYMSFRKKGHHQQISAAKAGLSERSARRIDNGSRSTGHQERTWRTRQDPLEAVWDSELKIMLENEPKLTADGLWEYLQDKYPGNFGQKIRRTLQRRVKQWKACFGPSQEVMFRQTKRPGALGISDFTHLKRVKVTIQGEEFAHLLYHYRLPYSGWRYVKVILGGESFEALSAGLQDALFRSGGVPQEHRTDSLSAAFNNTSEQERLTKRYQALCRYYDLTGSRNNPGQSHENGAIESPHGHLKRKLEQAIYVRGNGDFNTIEEYQRFIDQITTKLNQQCQERFSEERVYLGSLPKQRTTDFSQLRLLVSSSSTVVIKRVTYTVPSRLIGERVCVHLYDERLEIFCGHQLAYTLARVYTSSKERRRSVDYRHVISSLVKKPQAFRYSQIRDDLIPSGDYELIWTLIDRMLSPRDACRYFVKLLYVAGTYDCEQALGQYVLDHLQQGRLPTEHQYRALFVDSVSAYPVIEVQQHCLSEYDSLIRGGEHV